MNDKALMQEAWRLGYNNTEGFLIPSVNPKQAATIRFALYNATRAFRDGAKGARVADDNLRQALDNCQITITPAGVLIQRKTSTEASQAIMEALGREARTVEDYEMSASLERIMGKVAEGGEFEEKAAPTQAQQTATAYGARNI